MDEGKKVGYRSLFWPIILIGVGIIWLLANMKILQPASLSILIRSWPLILVVIGLDILIGRRSPLIGGLIGLFAVAAIILLILFGPSLGVEFTGDVKTLEFSEPIGEAKSAHITLDLERYPSIVQETQILGVLVNATLDTVTDVNFAVQDGVEKGVLLEPVSDTSGLSIDWFDLALADADWEIALSPDLPIDLMVDVGSGSTDLRLEDLQLTDLNIDGGSGSTDVTIPAGLEQYDVVIDGGSGSFDVIIQDEADLVMVIDVGSGSFDIDIGSDTNVEAQIDGGSGSVEINLPGDVGVRLVVRDRGSGNVRVPGNYNMVDDMDDNDSDTGIWESPGYDDAAYRIEIRFDPGSGSLTLR